MGQLGGALGTVVLSRLGPKERPSVCRQCMRDDSFNEVLACGFQSDRVRSCRLPFSAEVLQGCRCPPWHRTSEHIVAADEYWLPPAGVLRSR